MALFGSFAAVRARCARWPEFAAALAYAGEALTPGTAVRARIDAQPEGTSHRVELPGGAYAIESVYRTKARSEGFLETHRRYIDVQVVVAGEELMDVTSPAACTALPYDSEKDFAKHAAATAVSTLRIRAGEAAVFWPEDVHQPSIAVGEPALVRKVVIKVPV